MVAAVSYLQIAFTSQRFAMPPFPSAYINQRDITCFSCACRQVLA